MSGFSQSSGFFRLPIGLPVASLAARSILEEAQRTQIPLPDIRIFVPSRRASIALRDAFLRETGGRVMLLPRILPVQDIDEAEITLLSADLETGIEPACDGVRRQLALTRLLLDSAPDPMGAGEAFVRAAALADFFDEAAESDIDPARLSGLAGDMFARHWQKTLEQLTIVTQRWPQIRTAMGALDPPLRRKKLIALQAALWQNRPVTTPVYAIGLQDPSPATIMLLSAISNLPDGKVLLHGFDPAEDNADWQAILLSETHPAHELALLLGALDLEPARIPLWPAASAAETPEMTARRVLWRETMRPAATAAVWERLSETSLAAVGIDGLCRIDLETSEEEALACALILRETLEYPGRTAALVTADRTLARRTLAHLERWDVKVDDSAGQPLDLAPQGVFLRLCLEWLRPGAGSVDLLALFKHPFAAVSLAPVECRNRIRRIEMLILRGPRLVAGIPGMLAALRAEQHRYPDAAALAEWIETLRDSAETLGNLLKAPTVMLEAVLAAHLDFAEHIAASDTQSGAERLWRQNSGEAALRAAQSMFAASQDLGPFAGCDYPDIFAALMAQTTVRETYGQHPRLAVLGLIESRFRRFDTVIVGGLNDGVMPKTAAPDPWFSRAMRHDLGLPQMERAIGRSAADFVQCAMAQRVYLTRARHVDGAPGMPSRWLMRLDAVAERLGRSASLYMQPDWLMAALAHEWPTIAASPTPQPRPAPPLAARPLSFSVTEIETWLTDPYALYARKILGLTALPPLDDAPDQQERGTIIHEIFARFIKECGLDNKPLPPDALARLTATARAIFRPWRNRPSVMAVWWPRFEHAAEWFLRWETQRRLAGWHPIAAETKGSIQLATAHGDITLTAKADRIDRHRDGSLAVLDYKTGTFPKAGDIATGSKPQLPLEAVILTANGFCEIAPAAIAELGYVSLKGTNPPGDYFPWPDQPDAQAQIADLAATCRDNLLRLAARYANPRQPYPAAFASRGDYAHLARFEEWGTPVAAEDEP